MGAAAVGVVLGVAYTLSPLFVVTAGGFLVLLAWARRSSDAQERQVLTALLTMAIVLRTAAIAGLFISTDHASVPFRTFFGDEDYFIRRGLWLRNIATAIPVSPADMRYAFDPFIHTSYVWLLALLQLVFGPSPYGVHLVSALAYLAGTFALYRVVRPAFGAPASLVGLTVLLFTPSLFTWSISALKDPIFLPLMAAVMSMAVVTWRRPSPAGFTMALFGTAAAILMAQTMRDGALIMIGTGLVGGVMVGAIATRRRLAVIALAVAIVLVPAALSRGAVQDRIVTTVREAAVAHRNHVNEPGYVYTVLPPHYYARPAAINSMTFEEGAAFVGRALVSYVALPTPWHIKSPTALAFLPEQMLWYGLVLLAPIGIWAGFRRDPFLSSILLMQAAIAILLVAVTSGNIGTMVRHRGLAVLEIAWFSGLGLVTAIAWAAKARVRQPDGGQK